MRMTNKLNAGFCLSLVASAPGIAEVRRGEGVFLDSSSHINGAKICRFSNGTIVRVNIGEDCFSSGPARKNRTAAQENSAETPTYPAVSQSPVNKTTVKYRRGQGVYLNSSEHGPSGEKYCRFSNGVTIKVKINEDCFEEQPLRSVSLSIPVAEPIKTPDRLGTKAPQSSLKINMGNGIFLNSSNNLGEEKYCNFSNGLTYVVRIGDGCFEQEPLRVLLTKELEELNAMPKLAQKIAAAPKTSAAATERKRTRIVSCTNCKSRKTAPDPGRPD